MVPRRNTISEVGLNEGGQPIQVCILGDFRLLRAGEPVFIRRGGKTESLLSCLALHHQSGMVRETLLDTIWPDSEVDLAGQALNSLVYSLRKSLGDVINGSAPVLQANGCYCLNLEAGIGVDIVSFEEWVAAGDRHAHQGKREAASAAYNNAIRLYRGDLNSGREAQAIVERERLRAMYLTRLAYLADYSWERNDYARCFDHAMRLLLNDPCREDAHRMVMRCHVRSGERAQALRQYQRCAEILRAEYDAAPEKATTSLYEMIRLAPDQV